MTRFCVSLFGAFVTAATVALLYALARQLGYRGGAALGLAAIYGLATTAWPHGRTFLAEPLTAFLLGVAVGRGAEASASAARVTELAGAWSGAGDEEVAQVHHVAGHHQDALGAGEPASGEEQRDAE